MNNLTSIPAAPPFTIEESVNGISVHIRGRDRWAYFIFSAFPLVLATPIVIAFVGIMVWMVFGGIGEFIFKGQTDPETVKMLILLPVILLIAAGIAFGLYLRWNSVLVLIPGREVLELDEQSLTITRSIPFRHTRRIPAGKILGICHSGLFLRGPLAGATWLAIPIRNGLWIWRTGKFSFFPITICSGLTSVRANTILGRIHDRYPRYRPANQKDIL